MRSNFALKYVEKYVTDHNAWVGAKTAIIVPPRVHGDSEYCGGVESEVRLPNLMIGEFRFAVDRKGLDYLRHKDWLDKVNDEDTNHTARDAVITPYAAKHPNSSIVQTVVANNMYSAWAECIRCATPPFGASDYKRHDILMKAFLTTRAVTHELVAVRVLDVLGHLFDDDEDADHAKLGAYRDDEFHGKYERCFHGCTLYPGGTQYIAMKSVFETWKPWHRGDWTIMEPLAAFVSALFSWWFQDAYAGRARELLETMYYNGVNTERTVHGGFQDAFWDPEDDRPTIIPAFLYSMFFPLRLFLTLSRQFLCRFATWGHFDWAPGILLAGVHVSREPRHTWVGLWENQAVAYAEPRAARTASRYTNTGDPLITEVSAVDKIDDDHSVKLHENCSCTQNNLESLASRVMALKDVVYVRYPFAAVYDSDVLPPVEWAANVTRKGLAALAIVQSLGSERREDAPGAYHRRMREWLERVADKEPFYFSDVHYRGVLPESDDVPLLYEGLGRGVTCLTIESRTNLSTIHQGLAPCNVFSELLSLTIRVNQSANSSSLSWESRNYGSLHHLVNLTDLTYDHPTVFNRSGKDDKGGVTCFDCSCKGGDAQFRNLQRLVLRFKLFASGRSRPAEQLTTCAERPFIQLRLPYAPGLTSLHLDCTGWKIYGGPACLVQTISREFEHLERLSLQFSGSSDDPRASPVNAFPLFDVGVDTLFPRDPKSQPLFPRLVAYRVKDTCVVKMRRPDEPGKRRHVDRTHVAGNQARQGTREHLLEGRVTHRGGDSATRVSGSTMMSIGFETAPTIPVATISFVVRFMLSNSTNGTRDMAQQLVAPIVYAAMEFLRPVNDGCKDDDGSDVDDDDLEVPPTGYRYVGIGSEFDIMCRHITQRGLSPFSWLTTVGEYTNQRTPATRAMDVKRALENMGKTMLSKAYIRRKVGIPTWTPAPYFSNVRKRKGPPRQKRAPESKEPPVDSEKKKKVVVDLMHEDILDYPDPDLVSALVDSLCTS